MDSKNKFRRFCWTTCSNPWFDRIVLLLITISTILLAVDSPLDDPTSKKRAILDYIDYGMSLAFTLEMLTKIVAFGFLFCGPSSYIKNGWNILDFIIVAASLFSIAFSEYNISFLKALRMLRILRPLRLISRNKGLKLSITSLINSIPSIVNLMVIVTFCIFLLAILGTTLFGGKFYTCHNEHIPIPNLGDLVKDKWDCLNYGGDWLNQDMNFDTTLMSMLTLACI